jgi:acylphosphatase
MLKKGALVSKCIKITFTGKPKQDFLEKVVKKHARTLQVEGLAQGTDEGVFKIIVCGEVDHIDSFIDMIHKESVKALLKNIEVEPFLKDKDYRGVFRIIE